MEQEIFADQVMTLIRALLYDLKAVNAVYYGMGEGLDKAPTFEPDTDLKFLDKKTFVYEPYEYQKPIYNKIMRSLVLHDMLECVLTVPRGYGKTELARKILIVMTLLFDQINHVHISCSQTKNANATLAAVEKFFKENPINDFFKEIGLPRFQAVVNKQDRFIMLTGVFMSISNRNELREKYNKTGLFDITEVQLEIPNYIQSTKIFSCSSVKTGVRGLNQNGFRPDVILIDDLQKTEGVSEEVSYAAVEKFWNSTLKPLGMKDACTHIHLGNLVSKRSLLYNVSLEYRAKENTNYKNGFLNLYEKGGTLYSSDTYVVVKSAIELNSSGNLVPLEPKLGTVESILSELEASYSKQPDADMAAQALSSFMAEKLNIRPSMAETVVVLGRGNVDTTDIRDITNETHDIFVAFDPAQSDSKYSDFNPLVLGCVNRDSVQSRLRIIDIFKIREYNLAKIVGQLIDWRKKYGHLTLYYESNVKSGSTVGTSIKQALHTLELDKFVTYTHGIITQEMQVTSNIHVYPMTYSNAKGAKKTRIDSWARSVKNGHTLISPDAYSAIEQYMNRNSVNDDLVDGCSMLLEIMNSRSTFRKELSVIRSTSRYDDEKPEPNLILGAKRGNIRKILGSKWR